MGKADKHDGNPQHILGSQSNNKNSNKEQRSTSCTTWRRIRSACFSSLIFCRCCCLFHLSYFIAFLRTSRSGCWLRGMLRLLLGIRRHDASQNNPYTCSVPQAKPRGGAGEESLANEAGREQEGRQSASRQACKSFIATRQMCSGCLIASPWPGLTCTCDFRWQMGALN